ncbi:GntR family transcriptional regulator [Streptomyces tremellae]|uniref:GntR family transcriptional regulator n=1 Tax=Streptomyces tremellae TaxID=1124239 RepID=A0ABP7FEI1_9ACTN
MPAEPRQSAKGRAYDFIKREVLRGAYEGGDLISEGDVAKRLDMSRTPVREAFLRLEVEGLLKLYPQRGALVVPVSPAEVRSVLEARRLLERFAVEKLLAGPAPARDAAVEALAAHVRRQRTAGSTGDAEAFLEEDRLFHTGLLDASGNPLVVQFYGTLRDRQTRMIAESMVSEPHRRESIMEEHAEILDALRAGDGERTLAALDAHLASTRKALGVT